MQIPRVLRLPIYSVFARVTGIDLSEAELSPDEYASFEELFTRNLKRGLRPIGEGLVSPVDGTIRGIGWVSEGKIEQVKGMSYSMSELLSDPALAQRYEGGVFVNLYLSPRDYHHVHAPLDGVVSKFRHIPGRLLPVNDWSVRRFPQLFSQNERLVIEIESEWGVVLLVMVGATNVGRMTLTFDPLVTNAGAIGPITTHLLSPPVPVVKGSRLGTFHLGSTVVLILPSLFGVPPVGCALPRMIRFGETLLPVRE